MPKVKWALKPPNYLHDIFRRYMQANGMTSKSMAALLGVSDVAVRQQINKDPKLWRICDLEEYCEILQIPMQEALLSTIKK